MQCAFIKSNNEICEANAMHENEFCFLHNPLISAEEKRNMQKRGGESKHLTVLEPLPPIIITQSKDVVSLLTDTINRVRSGELDTRVANCLGVLSGHLLKAFEVAELENRLESIERVILERRNYSRWFYDHSRNQKDDAANER